MKLKDLRPNVKNPRKMSKSDKDKLLASLEKYGDLSGFVYNRRTKNLVGGHQRHSVLPSDATIKIDKKFETPTKSMTVAVGRVQIGEELFLYREVDADEQWEAEAMIAANKHSGDWDGDALKILFADFPDLDFGTAGFKLDELREFKIEPIKFEIPPPPPESELTDEQYVRETPQTTEQIPTENPNENVVYEEVKEDLSTKNSRHLVVIECPTVDVKDKVKEKLRTDKLVEEYGVILF